VSLTTDPVIRDAIRLRDRLLDVTKEHDYKARAATHKSTIECAEMDAQTCRAAAAMLEKLGTEVTRLRLGIGHLHYGMMDRLELNQMTKNWNADPAKPDHIINGGNEGGGTMI